MKMMKNAIYYQLDDGETVMQGLSGETQFRCRSKLKKRAASARMLRVYALLLLPFLIGCSSYSFRARMVEVPDISQLKGPCKFRLNAYEYQTTGLKLSQSEWSLPGNSSRKVSRDLISVELVRMWPDLFTSDNTGFPIDVIISISEGHSDQSGAWILLFSVGVLPSRLVYLREPCVVSVSLSNNHEVRASEVSIDFSTKSWCTLYSPFGCMMSDEPGAYAGVCRLGAGVNLTPSAGQCGEDQRAVFVATVARAILCGLGKMDPNEIRRLALFHALNQRN